MIKSILQSRRHRKVTESLLNYLENGKAKAISKASELLATSECSLSQILNKSCLLIQLQLLPRFHRNKRKISFIVGSPPENSLMTLFDSPNTYNPFTLSILLFRIFVRELISLEKGCQPFWTPQCKELSEKLLLPTKTVLQDSASNSLNKLSKKEVAKLSSSITTYTSHPNKNLPKICLPSSMYSTASKWESGDTVLRTLKVRIYPNKNQKLMLHQWFGTCRYVYNKMVHYSKAPTITEPMDCLFNPYHYLNFQFMRNIFVTKKNNEYHLNDWEFETPKEVRAYSVKEFVTRTTTNIENIKKGTIARFKMNYKSKKQKQTIKIPKQSIKYENGELLMYHTIMKEPLKIGKRTKKLRNIEIDHDVEIHYDGLKYYLLIPQKRPVNTAKENKKDKQSAQIIALDPGVRTFQTGFGVNGLIESKIDKEKQEKYFKKIQKLQSLRDKKSIKHNPQNKILRLFEKIRNITDETHYKLVNYLTDTYNDILLPSFESQDMVMSKMLHKSTKRQMNFNQHYKFKTRLKERCEAMTNTRLHIVNEAYTSKTCTKCGCIKENLGSNKIYKCDHCGCVMKRDFVGARNIFLKYASLI